VQCLYASVSGSRSGLRSLDACYHRLPMLTRASQLPWLVAALVACSSPEDAGHNGSADGGSGGNAGRGSAGIGSSSGSSGAAGLAAAGSVGSAGTHAGSGGNVSRGGGSAGIAGAGAGGAAGRSQTGGTSGRNGGAAGSSAGTAGSSGAAGAGGSGIAPVACEESRFDAADFETVYEVGPGRQFETPSAVPWEALAPSTLVRIHARPEPYRDKWVINAAGSAEQPIVVVGVPEGGALPVITGEDAVTRAELDYWGEVRGIVKIGGANVGDGAAHITVACLDIQTARTGVSFSDPAGASAEYADNAACLYLEEGHHVTLEQNVIHGCGNGIFASSGMSDVVISGNLVYDNGNAGSIYEHNSYTEATNITFEFNHYGPLCTDCGGNNLKDRSAGTVVRYNWIEGGNRQLDLVQSDHIELIENPAYRETFVYGNVLVEPDGAGNSQIVHYGGDSGEEEKYRKGTLYFFHNTVVSTRSGNTTLFRLSSDDEHVDARNNLFYVSAGGDRLALLDETGSAELAGNWLPSGWVESHGGATGAIVDVENLVGQVPEFTNPMIQDYSLCGCSPCRGAAVELPPAALSQAPQFQYVKDHSARPRLDDGAPDIGAFEYIE
jgi:parallel beta-helix repeat protein